VQSKRIICCSYSEGKKHDFKLFKDSKIGIHSNKQCQADTGYQGIHKLHPNSVTPKKRYKKHPLSKEDKRNNRALARSRVLIENIIREMKIFKIVAEKYRNRRKKFGLRVNLIAAIYNLNLKT
jgi:hypothetical protein